MDILAFFGSVWLAIIAGVFVLAMVIGCTFDRRADSESAKWWIFFIGVFIFTVWNWKNGYRFSWEGFVSSELWRFLGIYLAIGFAYSIIEFALDVRRSVRYWRERWASYLHNSQARNKDGKEQTSRADIANSFVSSSVNTSRDRDRIIGVAINPESKDENDRVIPKINRGSLAEHIGVWMLFWPFYAVSLIIGDLVTELARIAADIFAKISGRFVRMSFANVFKF